MSGCPSSCAQTYTGDIGLKGVRVRRGSTTCDAFDVLVGGGVQGRVELGRLYRKGVDLVQLPEVISQLVRTYDEEHELGQTFSRFWRQRLGDAHQASALGPDEHRPDVWLCESCSHQHRGDDPPVFCPRCAALRRNFVRLDPENEATAEAADTSAPQEQPAEPTGPVASLDGYREACTMSDLRRDGRRAVQVDGRDLAVFLVGEQVRCLDGLCPHEGGPMAEGELAGGIVTCPWHGWAFHCDDGRSVDGEACSLRTYPVKVEDGRVFVALPAATDSPSAGDTKHESGQSLRVVEVVQETPDTRTIRLDNSARMLALHRPGQHVKVCVSGPAGPIWRSFTISSPPTRPDMLEVTVKRNPAGIVSSAVHSLCPGDELMVQGPLGRFVFDPETHNEPLVLAAAGSGITPAMSILRTILDLQLEVPVTLLYGCRAHDDVIFGRELDAMRLRLARFRLVLTLSRPDPDWTGSVGRVTPALLARHVPEPAAARHFLCGPGDFVETLSQWLRQNGVPAQRIHSERFGRSGVLPIPPQAAEAALPSATQQAVVTR